MQRLAFIDTETTGLDPFRHDVWEVAIILRQDGHDTETVWHLRPSLFFDADPKALELTRYYERVSAPDWTWDDPRKAAWEMFTQLDQAVIVGSNPGFDTTMLMGVIERHAERRPTWHYCPIDITTLALGCLYGQAKARTQQTGDPKLYGTVDNALPLPWRSYQASEALGVPRPTPDVAHTALGDARWARDVYDAVTTPGAFYTASDEELSAMASQALSRPHGGGQ